ncbi:MAG: hypothetical protein UX17_C0003G0012 [Parcubacteria group bacterium GW2011_GWC2_45_7]|nr:MAG: hypothetical protein UX17_C0003G0012 [Parcubacteria group bacterium GW2011_GWC2_45_7]KKU73173.1 MAG: hypothetical protein UX98_C0010G0015 [Parcubacteria group bacterium GW2011_GWA2_47_26]
MPNEEKLPASPAEIEKVPEAPKEAPVLEMPEKPSRPSKEMPEKPALAPQTPAPAAVSIKEPILQQIESILAEDLDTVYAELPPELKPKFKAKGEEVASSIREMMKQAKVKAQKILKLIINWLKMVPGVNRFFIEQEAAIKTQRILFLSEQEKEKKGS